MYREMIREKYGKWLVTYAKSKDDEPNVLLITCKEHYLLLRELATNNLHISVAGVTFTHTELYGLRVFEIHSPEPVICVARVKAGKIEGIY